MKKYNSIAEWRNDNPREYEKARVKGWIDAIIEANGWSQPRQKPQGYWTLNKCMDSALKYKTREKWRKGDGGASQAAYKFGWYDECTEHMPKVFRWTKELCIADALKYGSIRAWQRASSGQQSARSNGWLDECIKHMIPKQKPSGYWTKERCMELAKAYTYREEFKKGKNDAYQAALRCGWYVECTKHMVRTRKISGHWASKENCINEARKYTTRTDWAKYSDASFRSAKKNGWFKECITHMIDKRKPLGFWTIKDNCINEARKYTTRSDWAKYSISSHASAKKKGWFEECTKHMIITKVKPGHWASKENCINEAIKYTTRTDWAKNNSSSYQAAKRNGWYEECTKHMK